MATTFERMQELHKDWHQRRCDSWRSTILFTRLFTNEFRSYIGAPEGFRANPMQDGDLRPYVSLAKCSPLNADDEYKVTELEPYEIYDQHISEEKSDGLVFAIKLTVDSAKNSWPKHPFVFRLSFKPKDGRCKLNVFRQGFDVDMRDKETWKPVFDHMVAFTFDVLQESPGDSFGVDADDERVSNSIGFFAPAR